MQVGDVVKLTVVLDGAGAYPGSRSRRGPEDHELWRHKVALAVDGDAPTLAQLEAKFAEDKPR